MLSGATCHPCGVAKRDIMPKMKSVSGAKKRFRKTGSGAFKHMKAGKSHILTKKTRKRKRRLRQSVMMDKTNEDSAARMLPYA